MTYISAIKNIRFAIKSRKMVALLIFILLCINVYAQKKDTVLPSNNSPGNALKTDTILPPKHSPGKLLSCLHAFRG